MSAAPIERALADLLCVAQESVIVTRTGSEAFLCLLLALEVALGEEVLLPISICQTMANAALLAGAIPVFADCDRDLAIEPAAVAAHLRPKTRVVVFHHPHGLARDLSPIRSVIARSSCGALLVEDCAQSTGAYFQGRAIGTSGDVALYSFARGKPLAAGGGGALVCADPALNRRVRRAMQVGVPGWPDDECLGWNSSLPRGALRGIGEAISCFRTTLARRTRNAEIAIEAFAELADPIHRDRLRCLAPPSHVFHRVILDRMCGDAQALHRGLEPVYRSVCQTAVPVAPPFTPFLRRRYRESGREDLYIDALAFPTWCQIGRRYLFLRTGPGISPEALLATRDALAAVAKRMHDL